MDEKRLRSFAITHFAANIILTAICISLMLQRKFKMDEFMYWLTFLGAYGLIASFVTKRKLWEYLVIFIVLIPIVVPIMYTSAKGMLPGELVLFDALGVLYIYVQYSKLD